MTAKTRANGIFGWPTLDAACTCGTPCMLLHVLSVGCKQSASCGSAGIESRLHASLQASRADAKGTA